MSELIKATLIKKRFYDAERHFLIQHSQDGRCTFTEKQKARLLYVGEQLSRIDSWIILLSDDEAFVIQKHLIDGVDIPRIVVAYRERWGKEFAKTERTVKSYQRRAIQKIEKFESYKVEMLRE